jgi:putative spermidine/putrescine transport system permease protein
MRGAALRRAALLAPALLLLVALLAVPLGYLAELSFRENVPGRMVLKPGFTLAGYARVLGDGFYLGILGRTLWLSAAVTSVSLVFGFAVAYALWRAPARWKTTLTLLVIAPLLISLVVRAYGWIVLLGDTGLVNRVLLGFGLVEEPLQIMYSAAAVFLGLVHVQFPFMVLSLLAAMERIDPALLDAAETLGASRARAVAEVVLPLSLPGVVAGCTLVFTLCMTAFVTPQLLGGSGTRVMTTLVYNQFTAAFNWPLGSALAVVLSGASLGVVVVFSALMGRLPSLRRIGLTDGAGAEGR